MILEPPPLDLTRTSAPPRQPGRDECPALTVVVPFYNEQEAARDFLIELGEAIARLGLRAEVLLVDDGSTDQTLDRLLEAAAPRTGWRVLRQARNRGQAAALLRGLHEACAPLIATLDGDGQNVPADLGLLLARLQESGADLVAGVRAQRQDSWLRRRMSRLANGVRRRFLQDGVSDTGCALKVFRREVVSAFLPMRTLYSFMPALAVAAGYRVVEQSVQHRARQVGTSKYGLGVMLWRPLVDMLGVWWFTKRRIPGGGDDR